MYEGLQDLFIYRLQVYPLKQHLPNSPAPGNPFYFLSRSHVYEISYSICPHCLWIILLSVMSLEFVYVVANGGISFFLITEQYSIVYM